MSTSAVEKIHLAHLKNERHVQFHETINVFFTKQNLGNLGLTPLHTPYKVALSNEVEALDFIQKSELTEQIHEKDHLRDAIYRGLFDTIKGARKHFNSDSREDGRILYDVIKHYGNIAKKTLDDETAAINDLLRELKAEPLAGAINRLNLFPWVDELEIANQDFEDLMILRYTETAAKTPYRMATARLETDKYYRAMINHIENLALVNPTTVDELVRELNAVITRFKSN